jgi:hypothetical protein
MHHAANPEFSLRGDEEQFIARRARPFHVLAAQKAALIIENRLAGVNLFATAFTCDHRIDEPFEFIAPPRMDPEPS